METVNKICIIIVYGIICFIIGYCIADSNNSETEYNNGILPDTTYNKVVLDSIEYNIKIKDSTILELKKRIEYETEQAINANNSNAVKQFYELAGAN